jgi:hypothetical protein
VHHLSSLDIVITYSAGRRGSQPSLFTPTGRPADSRQIRHPYM